MKWAPDLPDGEMNFYSGGADGKIVHWVLMQTELSATTTITLFLDKEPVAGPDGTLLKVKGAVNCRLSSGKWLFLWVFFRRRVLH